jgi:hypothetical protein
MTYTVVMGSGAVIYTPSFRHSEVDGGGGGIQRQHGDRLSVLFIFSKITAANKIEYAFCAHINAQIG